MLRREPAAATGRKSRLVTNVRFAVLWVTTLTSFIMYLDRICVAEIRLSKLDSLPTTRLASGLNELKLAGRPG